MIGSGLTFPLVSRRRLIGLAFGSMHGARRGSGSDIAGSRPYVPGDDPHRIDWASSARLSAARGTDEFIVREYLADEAPRAVVCLDRRPAMSLCPPGLPFLHKAQAAESALALIEASVAESRGLVGRLELERPGLVGWCPPTSGRHVALVEHALPERTGAADAITGLFEFLTIHRRSVPSASFVFVLSDFLEPTPLETWEWALDRGWDVVPVVIQDPTWERSFPEVHGVALPIVDAATGRRELLRLSAREVAERREAHEARAQAIVDDFHALRIEPVTVTSADPEHVLDAFLQWADGRVYARGAEWRAA